MDTLNRIASRPRVLVFAYACEPGRGSEPGAGWGLVQTVSEFADCVVLVAPEHVPGIRRWESEHPSARVSFVEVTEPWIARFGKWHRIPWFLVYLAWLKKAYRLGLGIHGREPFDIVYHATYAAYWLPAPLTRFGVPSVWGPVGGGATTPLKLWRALGWKGWMGEITDFLSVRLASWWPATRRTWRNVTVPIVQNRSTLQALPSYVRDRARLLNHVLFTEIPDVPARRRRSHILCLSALESRKGPRLAIQALAHASNDVELLIVGDGPERGSLERLAHQIGVAERVRFLGRVPRDEVFGLLAEAAAVVFTGLREEGGVALAEAMLSGAPTIVLAHGGPQTIAETAIDPARVILIEPDSLPVTSRRIGDAMTLFSRNPPATSGSNLDQVSARRVLRDAFREAVRLAAGRQDASAALRV